MDAFQAYCWEIKANYSGTHSLWFRWHEGKKKNSFCIMYLSSWRISTKSRVVFASSCRRRYKLGEGKNRILQSFHSLNSWWWVFLYYYYLNFMYTIYIPAPGHLKSNKERIFSYISQVKEEINTKITEYLENDKIKTTYFQNWWNMAKAYSWT